MNISDEAVLTVRYVTTRYIKLAKEKHPDKIGGNNSEFQELVNAYRRIIKHIEKDA